MKKYAIFTAILVTTFFQVSLIAANKVAPSVEIISTDPPCPAILEPGQRLYVKLRYDAGDTESFRIWVRPKGLVSGCMSHPCKSITKKTGEYEGWFYFNGRATVINEIEVKMKDNKSKGYMLKSTYPLKAEWEASKEEGPQGYSVGNASIEIVSTDPPCPAILESGQKLNIKIRYNGDGAKSGQLFIYTVPGGKTSRCLSFKKGEGILDGYVFFDDRAVDLSRLRMKLYDTDTKRYLVDGYCPVDATWKAPGEKIAKQDETAKPTDPFAVIHDAIAKKYAKKYEGVWTNTIAMPDGRKRPVIIKAARNKNGNLSFSFLQNPFASAPIFQKHSIDQYRVSIYFKLDNSGKVLMYSLARRDNALTGNLHLSWQDKPQKVALRKLNLSQAVSALEQQYEKNARLEQVRKSDLRNIAKLKKQITELQAKLKTSDSEKRKVETSFANARKINKKQREEYRKVTNELRNSLAILKKKNNIITERLVKSKENVKSYNNKNEQLKNVQLMLKLEVERQILEMSGLKKEIQQIKAQNRTLRRDKKQLQKKLEAATSQLESTRKQNNEDNEDDPPAKQRDSDTQIQE